jgi:F0F1-type ATP synthase assembly protein I/CxxC motif-containing protein
MKHNDIINKSLQLEKKLESLLKERGYKILKKEIAGGYALRPDFVLLKNGKRSLVELKIGNIISEKTFYQIMYYLSKIKVDSAYLAIPQESSIKANIKKKLLDNNIGIITIKDRDLSFEEPKNKRDLSQEDLLNLELFSDTKNAEERLEKTQERLEQIPIEFFLYIIIGGLIVYCLSKLMDYYIRPPIYFLVILVILGVISYFIIRYYKNKIKNLNYLK